jgi:predicted nucleic acid-binding Zn ribbon protein
MFCPKCGKEIPDDKQFCDECGTALFKKVAPDTHKKSPGLILMGIFVILAMYLIPIIQPTLFGSSYTLAKNVELCSSPLPSLNAMTHIYGFFMLVGLLE